MFYFLVPALNETHISATIRGLIDFNLRSNFEYNIFIVDDGSNPKLATLIAADLQCNNRIKIFEHESNQGPGRAFQTAFKALPNILSSQDIIVTLEGDGTSTVDSLPTLFAEISKESNKADLVLASPYLRGGGLINSPLWRKVLSFIGNKIFRIALGLKDIKTLSSFYRAFSGDAINKLRTAYGLEILNTNGFVCMLELVWKSRQIGLVIREVPFILDGSLRQGPSKMKVTKTILEYIVLVLRVRFKPNRD